MARDHEDARVGEPGPDLLHDLQAVQSGQEKIHHQQARLVLQAKIKPDPAVAESADHIEAADPAQCHRQHLPENGFILDNDRSHSHDTYKPVG